jgi:hypothetical protein
MKKLELEEYGLEITDETGLILEMEQDEKEIIEEGNTDAIEELRLLHEFGY